MSLERKNLTGGGGTRPPMGTTLPVGYQFRTSAAGALQVWRLAADGLPENMLSEQDVEGLRVLASVSAASPSSIHSGEYGIGSGGDQMFWSSDVTNIAQYPSWSSVSLDGLVKTPSKIMVPNAARASAESAGPQLATGAVDYNDSFTGSVDVMFHYLETVPAEAYVGRLRYRADRSNGSKTGDFYFDASTTPGVRITIPFRYPLRVKVGEVFNTRLTKADGTFLKVRPSATQATKPYRKSFYSTFVEFETLHAGNPLVSARSLETLTGADRLDALKLKNTDKFSPATETAIKTASFLAKDGGTYIIEQPTKAESGGTVETLYLYTGAISTNASHNTAQALSIFKNSPDKSSNSPDGWGANWNSHDENSATACRVTLDFGEVVQLVGMEWQGQGNTGYVTPNGPLPISGPRTMTARFSTNPFTPGLNSGTGNLLNLGITTQNLNWGANQSSPNGLAERSDLKAWNSGVPVAARYFALDLNTSWDTRNMLIKHILFTFAKPVSGLDIDVTIDSTVKSFTLMDGNANVAAFSAVNVVLGADTIKLSKAFIGKRYEFFRSGTKFIAVGSDGSRTEGSV